jgi:hypothetical protein
MSFILAILSILSKRPRIRYGPVRETEGTKGRRAAPENFSSATRDRHAHAKRASGGQASRRGGAACNQEVGASGFEASNVGRVGRVVHTSRVFLGSAGCQPAVAGSLPATPRARLKRRRLLVTSSAPSRQSAEMNRPAACAPQISVFDPREQRHRFADNMPVGQPVPLRISELEPLFFPARLHLPIQLIEHSMRRARQNRQIRIAMMLNDSINL